MSASSSSTTSPKFRGSSREELTENTYLPSSPGLHSPSPPSFHLNHTSFITLAMTLRLYRGLRAFLSRSRILCCQPHHLLDRSNTTDELSKREPFPSPKLSFVSPRSLGPLPGPNSSFLSNLPPYRIRNAPSDLFFIFSSSVF